MVVHTDHYNLSTIAERQAVVDLNRYGTVACFENRAVSFDRDSGWVAADAAIADGHLDRS